MAEAVNPISTPPAPQPPPPEWSAHDLGQVIRLWNTRDHEAWLGQPELFRGCGERLLKLGEPLLAYDVLRAGEADGPDGVRMRQLQALALARSGAADRASQILQQLRDKGSQDEETLSLLARTYKDQWEQTPDQAERSGYLEQACARYTETYRLSNGYWSGINAATMSLCAGHLNEAHALARRVREQCVAELTSLKPGDDAYWLHATLGEAALIVEDCADAERWYRLASADAGKRYGNLASTRRNARLLLRHLGRDPSVVDGWLDLPRVVVFSGHMVDRPNRLEPRFPQSLESAVAAEVSRRIAELQAAFGYSSPACGADLIFLESLRAAGAQTHVVLPYDNEQFLADSVEFAGPAWVERFHRAIDQASTVTAAATHRFGSGVASLDYANQILHGLAAVRARQMGGELVGMVVWDGKPGDGPAGTAANVRRWRDAGMAVEVIDLAQLTHEHSAVRIETASPSTTRHTFAPDAQGEHIMAMLFADAVGFSKLGEDEIPLFVHEYLGLVAQVLRDSPAAPSMKNTWGDGLYFVFDRVQEAGVFALELCDRIAGVDWLSKGFRQPLNLRIALHVGPVFACTNPVTGKPDCVGTHVSKAARIEPVTPPGQVYASEAFAAIAAAQGVEPFRCDYVGQTALAKGYGTFPMYHVRWHVSPVTARRGAAA